MSVVTPNMNLIQPTIGFDSGLTWENAANANSGAIDQHNHASGNGVQIPSAGININSDFSFNNFSAVNLASSVYAAQTSLATLLATYVIGNDLYYNDGAGNTVQLTSGGTVNATSSGISDGTATAAFSTGVLVVNAAANTPANIQVGSVLLGNNVASSNFLTLSPPAAMAANFGLTLPNIPASQSFMTIDASGNMGTASSISATQIAAGSITGSQLANQTITGTQIASATVARSNQVAVGQQVSSSCGSYSFTGATSLQDVTNLTVTITTSGRPVMLSLQSDTTGAAAIVQIASSNTIDVLRLLFVRGASTVVNLNNLRSAVAGGVTTIPSSCYSCMNIIAAGTYTYKVQIGLANSANTATLQNIVLVAYEL